MPPSFCEISENAEVDKLSRMPGMTVDSSLGLYNSCGLILNWNFSHTVELGFSGMEANSPIVFVWLAEPVKKDLFYFYLKKNYINYTADFILLLTELFTFLTKQNAREKLAANSKLNIIYNYEKSNNQSDLPSRESDICCNRSRQIPCCFNT